MLLAGGTLYSLTSRTYRSLRLPEGWTVAAGAYSPDSQALALLLVGQHVQVSTSTRVDPHLYGPVNKIVRTWHDSTRLLILDRGTGTVKRTWRLPVETNNADWRVSWISTTTVSALGFDFDVVRNRALKPHPTSFPASAKGSGECPRTLAETTFQTKNERFALEAATCSTPPERSDTYRLLRENERTHKDAILWEYRVVASTTACSAPYACYTGNAVQFLSTEDRLFLVWDGDLYALTETEDGVQSELVTQLLPQYQRPWGLAAGETRLDAQDIVSKVTFQPVSANLPITRGENPMLYAQNFSPTRSFNAAVEVGPYAKSLMVPAGYQVGPVEIGPFKERAYTPLLISVTWTAFHHIVDPIFCEQPHTLSPTTRGILVSLSESDGGGLRCRVSLQEER